MIPARRPIGAALLLVVLATLASCARIGEIMSQPPIVGIDNQSGQVSAVGTPDPVTRIPRTRRFDAVYAAFFPGEVTVHQGDTIFFRVDSRGEPHAIALGMLVDRAGRQLDKLGIAPNVADAEAVPAMRDIPSILPLAPEEGRRIRLNGSAAEPCYLDSGKPPNSLAGGAAPCPQRSKPKFNGRQTFFGSGWLEDRKIFRLELSDDIEPGTYHVLDLMHRSLQHMKIHVVRRSRPLPSVKDLLDQTRFERLNQASRLKIAATAAWNVSDPALAVAGVGVAGNGSFVASFPEETLQVAVGGKVTWTVHGLHSITLDAPGDAKDGVLERIDGRVVLNEDAWTPINSGRVPAVAQGFRGVGAPAAVGGGSYDGSGDKHSGVLVGAPDAPTTYELTFTVAGTYRYYCVVHPVMTGKIEVGGRRDVS